MLDFVNMFFNYIAGVWTTVFGNTILTLGSVEFSLGNLIIAGLICIMAISLFWRGAKA